MKKASVPDERRRRMSTASGGCGSPDDVRRKTEVHTSRSPVKSHQPFSFANAGNRSGQNRARSGIVSVVVIVVLMLVFGLVAVYAKRAVSERRQVRREFHRQQATQLADAGVLRFRQQIKDDPELTSDVWYVSAGVLHQTKTASVEASVDGNVATIVARYPTNHPYPAQVTRTVPINSPDPSE